MTDVDRQRERARLRQQRRRERERDGLIQLYAEADEIGTIEALVSDGYLDRAMVDDQDAVAAAWQAMVDAWIERQAIEAWAQSVTP